MKLGILEAKSMFSSAESTEILGSLGHNITMELKSDATLRLATDRDVHEASELASVLGLLASS